MTYMLISILLFNVAAILWFAWHTRPRAYSIEKFEYDYETWYKVVRNGTFIGPDFKTIRSAKRFIRYMENIHR